MNKNLGTDKDKYLMIKNHLNISCNRQNINFPQICKILQTKTTKLIHKPNKNNKKYRQ